MKTKISVLFFIKRFKANAGGLVSIYMRLTVDGKRFENSTSRFVHPDHWAVKSGKVKPGAGEAKSINTHLDLLRKQVLDYQLEHILKGMVINTENLRNKISGATNPTFYF